MEYDFNADTQYFFAISPVEAKTYGDPAFDLATTGGNGSGAVSFTSSDPSIISINGSTAAIHKAGDVTITATKAGDAAFNPATATMTISVGKKAVVFKAWNVSVWQGDAMPAFTYMPVTLAAGDRVETEPTAACTATDTNTLGTFTITFSGAALTNQDNYIINYEPGISALARSVFNPLAAEISCASSSLAFFVFASIFAWAISAESAPWTCRSRSSSASTPAFCAL